MSKGKLFKKISFSFVVILLIFFIMPRTSYIQTEDDLPDRDLNIMGYEIGGSTYYAASIYWVENMVFIFDNGIYDSEKGKMVSSFPPPSEVVNDDTLEEDVIVITNDMVEKGAESGNIKKWYGFDGENNRIIVLNRSNAPISARYSAKVADSVGGETRLELYDHCDNDNGEGDGSPDGKGYLLEIEQELKKENYGRPKDFGDDTNNRFGKSSSGGDGKFLESETKKIIKGSPQDGTAYANKVFLNITGAPGKEFPGGELEYFTPGELGTITITLDKDVSWST